MTKKGSLVIAHNYWFEQFGDQQTIGEIPEEDFNSCSCHISMIECKLLCPSLIYD
ncbi:hypothetical protein AAG906_035625 [Vitis piasezkii]